MPAAPLLDILTPLGCRVRCTASWWQQVATLKHPVMAGQLAEVERTLADPDEVRRSRRDAKCYSSTADSGRAGCAWSRASKAATDSSSPRTRRTRSR